MQPTDIRNPDYFHKVVDCQWACPAHTPVPEYIRLIAAGRYDDAYLLNWESNVFPGILGRTCDRPCEPACRRGRVEENNGGKPEPVAICRLKRVTADFKSDIRARLPKRGAPNGLRIACVGAGPASLAVARDLAPLGYAITVFDADPKAGGFMRTQVPRFRLPESVIDEETSYILDLGVQFVGGRRIDSLKGLLSEGYDAAVSIDKFLSGEDPRQRPAVGLRMISQKMGIHEWSYDNDVSGDQRYKVPHQDQAISLKRIDVEVELGFDVATALREAERCLNCDVQTVFAKDLCIECDACMDICPMDCISFVAPLPEPDLRHVLRAPAPNLAQDLYVSPALKTGRVMVKDEDVCLHCSLCAERCPTGAWDMQKSLLDLVRAGPGCRERIEAAA